MDGPFLVMTGVHGADVREAHASAAAEGWREEYDPEQGE